jgi:hypothetical protein
MNDCVKPGNQVGRNRLGRIPANLILAGSRSTHQACDLISAGFEERNKGGPDWPGNTADQDSRDHEAALYQLAQRRNKSGRDLKGLKLMKCG